MTMTDDEILDVFERAVRPMRRELPDEVLAALQESHLAGDSDPTPVDVVREREPADTRVGRRGRSALALVAAGTVLVGGLALLQRDRRPESPGAPAATSAVARASGTIADPKNVDFSPWLAGAPAWPPAQPSAYLVFDIAALDGWTQLDTIGGHPIGQGDGYDWSSNVNDPDGRQFHVAVTSGTDYPTAVANALPVDINGISGQAGEGEVSWPLDATHTGIVTEFGTIEVDRAVALARELTTVVVPTLSSQLPPGSLEDAVPDPGAQFGGVVEGVGWSTSVTPDGMTTIVDGIVREFRGADYVAEYGTEFSVWGNNDLCVFVAAYMPLGAYQPRLVLSDETTIELPVVAVNEDTDAFVACLPYALDALRIELVYGPGSLAGSWSWEPYLYPSTGAHGARFDLGTSASP